MTEKWSGSWVYARWLLVIIGFALGYFMDGWVTGLLLAVFVIVVILGLDERIPLGICLALLVLCPLMVLLDQKATVDVLATVSFYFLALGIGLLFVKHIKESWSDDAGR